MGDFYIDDQFFEHPKAVFAGEDAANLYVRGLAWAHRHNTGLIPKGLRLSSRKDERRLADQLCLIAPGQANPLWHDRGDHYEIHDWETRNQKMIAKRKQAKAAAEESWRQRRERANSYADAYASASDPHMRPHRKRTSERSADAMPYQKDKDLKAAASLSVTHEPRGPSPAAAALLETALNLLADRRLATNGQVNNPAGYRKATIDGLRADHAQALTTIQLDAFETAEQLANALEPAHQTRTEMRALLHDQRPECETCTSSGWILDEDGNAYRCTDCSS